MDSSSWILAFLTVYVCFVSLLFYTIICGGSPRHEAGILGRANAFITVKLLTKIHSWTARVFCPHAENPEHRAGEVFQGFSNIFEKYIMPAFYLGMLFGGIFAAKGILISRLPELDALDSGSLGCPRTKLFCLDPVGMFTIPPRTKPEAVYVYAILAFGSWLAVYLANPGIVTAETFEIMKSLYRYDEVIFVSGKECATCKRPKLPRTKHDGLVGGCIARYDHFCGWTGNAIGLYNTNRFCVFLLVHLTMLAHGSALCAELIYGRMLSLIDGGYTYVPTGEQITHFSIVIAFAAEPTLCIFLFVLVLTLLMVGAFLYYHLSLVASNVTTSEAAKWTPVNKACSNYLKEHGRSYGKMLRELAEKEASETGASVQSVPLFQENGLPVNVYDRGTINNILEVMFPSLFVRQSEAEASAERVKGE
jgi:palmitoyltransferase ZDHHC4